MQGRNIKPIYINDHEAANWSAGKLKLMCSIGSDRWYEELLCRRAQRGHGISFVLQCAWYTALHVSHCKSHHKLQRYITTQQTHRLTEGSNCRKNGLGDRILSLESRGTDLISDQGGIILYIPEGFSLDRQSMSLLQTKSAFLHKRSNLPNSQQSF